MIEVKNIHKKFGDNLVLNDVSFNFQRGKTNLIIGESGSGKTTLLKIIMGVLIPDKGSVKVLDNPPSQSVQEIGYMPQFASFSRDFPISVEDTVLMGRLGKTSSIGFFNNRCSFNKSC